MGAGGAGGVGGVVSIVGGVVSTLTEGGVVDPLLTDINVSFLLKCLGGPLVIVLLGAGALFTLLYLLTGLFLQLLLLPPL